MDSTVKESRFQGGKGGQARRASLGKVDCTNQQPLQRGGAVPDPVWVGSKWMLDFLRVPVTLGTLLHFFLRHCPLNNRRRAPYSFLKIGCLFSLSALLCVLIASTIGLAFSLLMTCMLATLLSFSSGKAYPFLNFLPPLFLRLIPTLTMQGSTSLLTWQN